MPNLIKTVLVCICLTNKLQTNLYICFHTILDVVTQDMKSLTDSSSSSRGLNLQTRVIKSGLDSITGHTIKNNHNNLITSIVLITGDDATSVIALFEGLAIFQEDQVVAVPVVGILCKSLNFEEGTSSIRLRHWLSDLLGRSILLGSIQNGVSMQ